MKKILFFIIFCVSNIAFSFAQIADEKAINSFIANAQELWNKHDINAYNDLYTDDATLVNPAGIFCANKAEIVKMHLEANEFYFKKTSATISIPKMRLISPEMAVVNTIYHINVEQEITMPDGMKMPKGAKPLVAILHVLVKKNGTWKISATQVTNVMPPPTK